MKVQKAKKDRIKRKKCWRKRDDNKESVWGKRDEPGEGRERKRYGGGEREVGGD
jgi:hypothetical protein